MRGEHFEKKIKKFKRVFLKNVTKVLKFDENSIFSIITMHAYFIHHNYVTAQNTNHNTILLIFVSLNGALYRNFTVTLCAEGQKYLKKIKKIKMGLFDKIQNSTILTKIDQKSIFLKKRAGSYLF